MTPVAEKRVGRKPKGEPQQQPSDKKNVKVRAALHRKLAVVAAHRGIDIFDLIDGLLTGPAEREYEQTVREVSK